jgi:DNA-binding response OmpR family regulator
VSSAIGMAQQERRPLLIVEDDPDIEFAVADLVTDHGFRTISARDGLEALEVLHRERPSGILLDLAMPRMDGYALIEALRTDRKLSAIPVAVVTAQRPDLTRLHGLPVLHKPFDSHSLLQLIRAVTDAST